MSEQVVQEQVVESKKPVAAEANEAPKQEMSSSEAKQGASLEAKEQSGEKLTKQEQKLLKEYKLKVNGKEKVVKLDLSNDQEIQKYLQKGLAADEAWQRGSEMERLARELVQDLKDNPKKILKDPSLGLDIRKLAEDILNEEIQEMEKSPEQRELEKLRKELEERNKQDEERKKKEEEERIARLQKEHETNIQATIGAALDMGGLPKTARTVAEMAELMYIAMEGNIELEPKQIVNILRENKTKDFKELVTQMSDDQLEEFMGKEILNRLRKKNIAKAKAIESASSIKPTANKPKQEPQEPSKKDPKAFKKFFGI